MTLGDFRKQTAHAPDDAVIHLGDMDHSDSYDMTGVFTGTDALGVAYVSLEIKRRTVTEDERRARMGIGPNDFDFWR